MRTIVKSILNTLLGILVSPATGMLWLQSCVGNRDQAFAGWSQLLSLIPGRSGVLIRHAFLRQTTAGCQPDVHVGFGTLFSHAGVSMGRSAYIGNSCSIGDVILEQDVLIASHVSIMNGTHQHGTALSGVPFREQRGELQPITIGRNTWIGERSIVAANVGQHCIIGAGSLVLKPLPDFCVAVGVPARILRIREPEFFDRDSNVESDSSRNRTNELPTPSRAETDVADTVLSDADAVLSDIVITARDVALTAAGQTAVRNSSIPTVEHNRVANG